MADDKESLSMLVSPVTSAWDITRKESEDIDRAREEMIMSGFGLLDNDEGPPSAIWSQRPTTAGRNQQDAETGNRDDANDAVTSKGRVPPRIEVLRKKYPFFLLHEFKDKNREREYERWFWKRNRRVWIRSVGYIFVATIVYYLQFFIVSPIQASYLSSARAIDPSAPCACYGYCNVTYNFVPDLLLLLIGNALPFLITMLIVHFTPPNIMSRIVHIVSFALATLVLNVNFGLRFRVVDPDGDSWFRTMLSMGLIFYPMMTKLSTAMTMVCSAITLTVYGVNSKAFFISGDISSQVVILIYMILCGILAVHLMWQFESSERKAFMVNLGLLRHNDKLRNQLQRLQNKYRQGITDLDSPLEKAIMSLQSIMANPNTDVATQLQIETVIQWLSASENIFTPMFDRPSGDSNQLNLDDEQEQWLMDLLPTQQRKAEAKKKRHRLESAASSTQPAIMGDLPGAISEDRSAGGAFLARQSVSRRPSASSALAPGNGLLGVARAGLTEKSSNMLAIAPNTLMLSNVALSGPEQPEQFVVRARQASTLESSQIPTSNLTLNMERDLSAERLSDEAAVGAANAAKERGGDNAYSTGGARKVSQVAARFLKTINKITATPSPLGAEVIQALSHSSAINGGVVSETDKVAIQNLLADVETWNWQIFEFEEMAPKPLYTLGLYMFHKAGLVGRFNLPIDKLRHFLLRIEAGYHPDIPYHNATHACDVLHATNFFISAPAIQGKFSELEILAAYLAAIIHDFDHPGVNNQFLINTNHTKAIFYNDRSILESHHLASAWSIICKDDSNFLQPLSTDEYRAVREQVIDMVLATDLTAHFATLSAFKNKVLVSGTFDLFNRDDRSMFWRIVLKCGDVSNLSKEWSLYEKWIERLFAEFFRQGDEEKKIGLGVSPFMDRDTVQISSSQISFMDFICMPMYEAFIFITKEYDILDTLQKNREMLLEIKEKERQQRMLFSTPTLNSR